MLPLAAINLVSSIAEYILVGPWSAVQVQRRLNAG